MKLNNRFIFGILSLVLAAVIAFVALPTIARQTNGKAEIIRITQPVLKGEKITSDNTEVVEVGGYNLPSNAAHSLSDVEGLYVTADLAEGDYILTSKVSSVPVSSDVALNDIPSGKVAISMTVKTLASGLSDKLQPNDIIRIYHFLETAKEVPELRFVMETLEAINRRYSCRRYDRSKLPEAAKIEILLHSAQVAPVACNKRDHIHISLISDLELLEAWDHAAACYVGAIKSHPLYHAPAVLLISVRPDASDPPENPYLNAGCAAENATLAATALGLGSVLLAMPVRALRKEEALLDRFALPDNFQPVIAVAFGYEQADPISRRKSLVSYKCNKASKEEDYNAMH